VIRESVKRRTGGDQTLKMKKFELCLLSEGTTRYCAKA
jgi:hypothetical protein